MKPDVDLEKGFFDSYASATTNLRTWLVAYGVGAPVLFLSNESVWEALAEAKCAELTGMLFLSGVAFQVVIAIINKYIMWFCYFGEAKPSFKSSWKYRFCDWFSERFGIDIFSDFASIACFVVATYRVYTAVISSRA